MRSPDIPTDDIVAMLIDRFEALVDTLYPGATRVGDVVYPRPKSKFDLGSFQIYLANRKKYQRGHWNRFSQRIGGGPLQLITYALSSETVHIGRYGEAVAWAKRWLGIEREMTPAEREAFHAARARDRAKAERERAQAQRQAAADLARARTHARSILDGSQAIVSGDPIWLYLTQARGLPIGDIVFPPALLCHPSLKHFGGKDHVGPAMVARLRGADGWIIGVHCTFVKPDGKGKALPGKASKLMRGDIAGGVVPIGLGSGRLSDVAAAGRSEPVILAEGIETALAIACSIPEARVWACLSLGNIAFAPVDNPAISQIFVAAENDTKPQAQEQLEDVLETLSRIRPVDTLRSHVGSDFADQF